MQAYETFFLPRIFKMRGFSFQIQPMLKTGLLNSVRCVFICSKEGKNDIRKFKQIAPNSIVDRAGWHVDCLTRRHTYHNRHATISYLLSTHC